MAPVQRLGRCGTELDGLMTDIHAIANELAGRPVKISWSDNKVIRANHASYSNFSRRIWVSTVFMDAPDEVVRCLIAHELGHRKDTPDHLLRYFAIAMVLVAFLALCINYHWFDWVGIACFAFAVAGGIVYLSINWEARADQWAEKAVGKDLYWSTKPSIREWADRMSR